MRFGILRALTVAGVGLAGAVGASAKSPMSGSVISTNAEMQQPAATPWRMAARGNVLEAAAHSSIVAVTPPYDSVLLSGMVGGRKTRCVRFGRPDLQDNGTSRTWVYRTARPAAGACIGGSVTGLFAEGFKGAQVDPTAQVQ